MNLNKNLLLSQLNINSLIVALFLCLQLFNHYLNLSTVVISITLLLFSIVCNRNLKISLKPLLLYLFVIFWFSITFCIFEYGEDTTTYFIFYLAFGTTALFLVNKQFSSKLVILYLACIHTVVSPFVLFSAFSSGSSMGEVYSFIAGFIALILCVFSKKIHNNSLLRIFFVSALVIYIYKFSLVNTRGAFLTVVVFFALYMLVFLIKSRIIMFFSILIFTFVCIFISNNLLKILIFSEELLNYFSINLEVLNKSIRLLELEKFDHNRDWYYEYAINGINNNLFFGQGIGSFELQTGRVYIHNIYLQLLFEGGIFYLIPFIFVGILLLKVILSKRTFELDFQLLIIILVSSSLVKLLFSETYLKEQKFMMLILLILVRKKFWIKEKEINKNEYVI